MFLPGAWKQKVCLPTNLWKTLNWFYVDALNWSQVLIQLSLRLLDRNNNYSQDACSTENECTEYVVSFMDKQS